MNSLDQAFPGDMQVEAGDTTLNSIGAGLADFASDTGVPGPQGDAETQVEELAEKIIDLLPDDAEHGHNVCLAALAIVTGFILSTAPENAREDAKSQFIGAVQSAIEESLQAQQMMSAITE